MMRELHIEPGELDLLAGCPPCQGFSTLRTRQRARSVEDKRNDLVFEFMRFVEAFRPKAIMMENVPNLASDNRMLEMLRSLKEWGYYGELDAVRVLNAADYGVPQRRRRMILLSGRFGTIPFARPETVQPTVGSAIGELHVPGTGTDPLHDYSMRHSDHVMALIRNVPKDGGSRTDLPEEFRLDCHRRSDGYKDVYGRMAWKSVAPTITSGCFNPSKGRFLHPDQDRAITLREASLLQTFPNQYHISLRRGRSAAAAQIGNALPPLFIKIHAEGIVRYLAKRAVPS